MAAESMEKINERFSPCSNTADTESILLSRQNTNIYVPYKNPCANNDNDDYNEDQLTTTINGRDLNDYTAMNLCWTMVYKDIVDKASTDTIQNFLMQDQWISSIHTIIKTALICSLHTAFKCQ